MVTVLTTMQPHGGWHNPWRYDYASAGMILGSTLGTIHGIMVTAAGMGGWCDPWYYGWGGYYNPLGIGAVRYTDMLAMVDLLATFAITTQAVLMVLITSITGVGGNNRNTYSRRSGFLIVALASVRILATLTITLLGVVAVILALVTVAAISEVAAQWRQPFRWR